MLVALKSRLCSVLSLKSATISLADVQSDVLLLSHMHTTIFSIDQQLWRFVIRLPMCHWCTDALHQVAGVTDMCLVQCAHIPAPVAKFCSRPGFRVNRTFGGHRSKEIKYGVSCWRSWTVPRAQSGARTHHFHRSYLKANKVSKNEETRKVEYTYHF